MKAYISFPWLEFGLRKMCFSSECLENRHTYKHEGSIKVLWPPFPFWRKMSHVKCECPLRGIAMYLLPTNTDKLIEFLKLLQSPHSPSYNPSDAAVAMVTAISTF